MRRALWVLTLFLGCSRVTLEPARYACSLTGPADQCPGDWRCLPEGFCVDPAVGGEWKCTRSSDCTGQWHCGVEGRCYQREEQQGIACRIAGPEGNDCAPGWTCGLDLRCLDTSKPNNNRCDTDLDCFGGQRCASARCINVQSDALRPSTTAPTLVREQTPFLGANPVTAFEVGTRRFVFGMVGTELRWLDILQTSSIDGGFPLHRMTLDEAPREFVAIETTNGVELAMLQRDGGVTLFNPSTNSVSALPLPFAAKGVRNPGIEGAQLVVLGDDALAVGKLPTLDVLRPDAGVVRDVFMTFNTLVLSTSTGGWVRPFSSPLTSAGWAPAFCDENGPMTQLQFVREGWSSSEFLAFVSDGGTTTFRRFQPGDAGSAACPTYLGPTALELLRGQEPGFPLPRPLSVLADFDRVSVSGLNERGEPVAVWTDGGTRFAVMSVTDQKRLVTADELGRVWLQERNRPGLEPLMPASPAKLALGRSAIVTFTSFDKQRAPINPLEVERKCFTSREGSWCQPGFSSLNERSTRGVPDLVSSWSSDPTPNYIAFIRAPDGDVRLAQQLTELPTRMVSAGVERFGSTLLVTGLFDYLSVGEWFAPLSPAGPRLAVSPLPRGTITDVVLTTRPSTAPESAYAEGWVVSSGRVFRFYAASRALWRSAEVVLPTDQEVVEVWLDDTRPRAIDLDGRVFALDSAVRVSEPLPNNDLLTSVAHRCNHDFAVGVEQVLYRLTANPDGGVLATWAELPTPLKVGRVVDEGDELRAFDVEGRTYWLDGLSCPTP